MNKKRKIFSEKANNYLVNEMCIDIKDLEEKIIKDSTNHSFFNELIEFMMDLKLPNKDDTSLNEFINTNFYQFLEENGLNENSPEYCIFDSIRHAFLYFKDDGILEMYQNREAEVWYPKIIIKNFIGIQEDIDRLAKNITIYRGTSQKEYNSNKFGQSWTLNKAIAEKFAFIYYEGQENYKNTLRVIIQAKIKKENIYYYEIDGIEDEVIIDSNALNNVEIIETKQI